MCLLRSYHKEGQPGNQASVPPKCKLERIVQVKWKRGSDCIRTEENLFALSAYASELNWLLLMRWLNNVTHSANMNLGKPGRRGRTGEAGVLPSRELQRHTRLSDWTTKMHLYTMGVQIPRCFLQQKATLLLDNLHYYKVWLHTCYT